MSVLKDICLQQGHKIESLLSAKIYDPIQKVFHEKYEHLCVKCGRGRDEIRNYRPSGPSGKRKTKGTENVDSNRNTRASEASQDPIPQPVPGSTGDVSDMPGTTRSESR